MCLGLDYKRGGFVDRAHEAFSEVLRFEPQNPYALVNLQKLHEEQHQWQQAREVRQQLVAVSPEADQARNRQILAFIENELGRDQVRRGDHGGGGDPLRRGLDLDSRNVPAHLNLGDLRMAQGRTAEAAQAWERVTEVAPERAYLAFDRLESLYRSRQSPDRFARSAAGSSRRTRRTGGRTSRSPRSIMAEGRTADALELLFEALSHSPHAPDDSPGHLAGAGRAGSATPRASAGTST